MITSVIVCAIEVRFSVRDDGQVDAHLGPGWPTFDVALNDSISSLPPRGWTGNGPSTYWIDHADRGARDAHARRDDQPFARGNETLLYVRGGSVVASYEYADPDKAGETMPLTDFLELLAGWRRRVADSASAAMAPLPETYRRNPPAHGPADRPLGLSPAARLAQADQRFRRLLPAFVFSWLALVLAAVALAVVSDQPWDTPACIWGVGLGVVTGVWPDISRPLVLALAGADGAALPQRSKLRRTIDRVSALVMAVSLGLLTGAWRLLWLDAVLSAMAMVIFTVGVVGGVVMLRRRRDQGPSTI